MPPFGVADGFGDAQLLAHNGADVRPELLLGAHQLHDARGRAVNLLVGIGHVAQNAVFDELFGDGVAHQIGFGTGLPGVDVLGVVVEHLLVGNVAGHLARKLDAGFAR